MPIIDWLFEKHRPDLGVTSNFAQGLGNVGGALRSRVEAALRLFPCDLLFVHRDAEGMAADARYAEIELAIGHLAIPRVSVVPVRMTEAWLLSDERAIRSAAENRNGDLPLNLPGRRRWEELPNPKQTLRDAIVAASGKSARALSRFDPDRQRILIAERTPDFSGLRGLAAFDRFESDFRSVVQDF